jgi:hypothetical protein
MANSTLSPDIEAGLEVIRTSLPTLVFERKRGTHRVEGDDDSRFQWYNVGYHEVVLAASPDAEPVIRRALSEAEYKVLIDELHAELPDTEELERMESQLSRQLAKVSPYGVADHIRIPLLYLNRPEEMLENYQQLAALKDQIAEANEDLVELKERARRGEVLLNWSPNFTTYSAAIDAEGNRIPFHANTFIPVLEADDVAVEWGTGSPDIIWGPDEPTPAQVRVLEDIEREENLDGSFFGSPEPRELPDDLFGGAVERVGPPPRPKRRFKQPGGPRKKPSPQPDPQPEKPLGTTLEDLMSKFNRR